MQAFLFLQMVFIFFQKLTYNLARHSKYVNTTTTANVVILTTLLCYYYTYLLIVVKSTQHLKHIYLLSFL